MRIFPASGVSSPRMHRNKVVFPPPEGPRIAANSPSCSPKETSFRTPWPSMDFLSPRTSRVGIHGDDLIVRIEPATTDAMLKEPGAKPFDLSGPRGMAGWLLVAPAGYRTDAALQTWVARGVGFASSLPKKRPSRKR